MALVRRVRPGDGELLRQVRLRALATDPLAFSSTLAAEQAWDAQWAAWAASDSTGGDRATFVTVAESGDAVGLAGGFRDRAVAGRFHLFSMWVAPEERRGGIATDLVEQVAAWASESGGRELCLQVTEPGALRFYERCGFQDDGRREPLPHQPSVTEIGMTRLLPG